MRALSIVAGGVAAIARFVAAGGVAAGLSLAAVSGAGAAPDTADSGALAAQKAQLFQQMLQDPSNLDVTFAYADVSAKLGENEAAIAALERMLLFNPNLPRVDLELGVLYFRLGSFDAALSYFQKAKSFNPPPEVTARVDEYMAKIAAAQSPNQFSGYVFFGAQYQSDANVAPGSPLILSPFGAVLLSNQFVKHDDVNLFGTGTFLYSYDLETQNRDTLEVIGTGFANHYMQFSRLDLDLGEVTAGPRFRFPHLADLGPIQSATLKPYAILNEVGLGENQYFYTWGAGIEGTALLFDDLSAKLSYEFREKHFTNAADRPQSSGLTGHDNLVSFALSKPITPASALTTEFDFLDQSTAFNFFTNRSYAILASYRIRYDDPLGWLNLPWETVVFGSRSWSIYAAPDPCCVTNITPAGVISGSARDDRHWRLGVTQSFQLSGTVALVVQAQRDVVSSNLPIYGYTSNSFLVGPQIRF